MRGLRPSEIVRLLAAMAGSGRLLSRTPRLSRELMAEWQLERVRKLVTHAYDNVPFYRSLYDSVSFRPADLESWRDFERLPVVTKDDVIANYPSRMLANGFTLEELIVSRSSGSSGKVLDIAYDGTAMTTFILAGLRLYRMAFNYLPWHTQLYVYTSPYPLASVFGLYPLRFLSTLTPIDEIVRTLVEVKPALIACYPSHLRQIAQSMTARDRAAVRPKAISVNSEMSTQAERDEMSALFGCPVLDEYSSEELTRIAAQCRHKTYHVFEDLNYIETLDDGGAPTTGMGTVVGTNLHNVAMPMIRYKQNDLGRVADRSCDCGWHFRALTELQGRANDSFVMPSGKILSSGFLLDATYEFLLTHGTAVRDFCLIQTRPTDVVLEVVKGAGWTDDVARAIARRFASFLEPGVTFRVELVQECEKTRTGKRNPIINKVGRAAAN